MRRPSPAFVLAFLALLASTTGVGIAAIPARDGDVHLCYSKKTGAVELVDTQTDQFACEKNWAGFAIDTKPTQLVSPNGQYKIEVTDTGAKMSGPDGVVSLGGGKLTLASGQDLDVTTGKDFTVKSGKDLVLTSGKGLAVTAGGDLAMSTAKDFSLRSSGDLGLTASKRLTGVGGTTLGLTADDGLAVTSGKALDLTGGSDVSVTGGKKVTARSGTDLGLISGKNATLSVDQALGVTVGKDMSLDVGKSLDVNAGDSIALQSKLVQLEAFVSMLLKTKDYALTASGKIDIKASKDVNIKGSKVKTN